MRQRAWKQWMAAAVVLAISFAGSARAQEETGNVYVQVTDAGTPDDPADPNRGPPEGEEAGS